MFNNPKTTCVYIMSMAFNDNNPHLQFTHDCEQNPTIRVFRGTFFSLLTVLSLICMRNQPFQEGS